MPQGVSYTWNLKYDTHEPLYETETDLETENRLLVAEGEGAGGGWSGRLGLADEAVTRRTGTRGTVLTIP